MKKFVILISIFAFCVGIHAKTFDEIMAEYTAITSENGSVYKLQKAYVIENKTDCITAFNEWKQTDFAKYRPSEKPEIWQKLNSEQEASEHKKRELFGRLYDFAFAEIEASDRVLCNLGSGALKRKMDVENPTFYQNIKSSGFIVDGLVLPVNTQMWLALLFDDIEYAVNYIKTNKGNTNWWTIRDFIRRSFFAKYLSELNDVKAAYEFTLIVESAIMSNPQKQHLINELKEVRDFQDTYYLRLSRANKTK